MTAAPDFTGGLYAYGSGSEQQGWYDNTVAVDPANANHVVAGGIGVVETTDGGTTWTNVNGKTFFAAGTNLVHPDFHALAFRPDSKVWLGNDGGMFLYNPAGPSVANSNGNLNITQFYAGFNEVGGSVLAGAQDNGSARTASPTVAPWTGIIVGDGGLSAITPNSPMLQFSIGNRALRATTDGFGHHNPASVITPARPEPPVHPAHDRRAQRRRARQRRRCTTAARTCGRPRTMAPPGTSGTSTFAHRSRPSRWRRRTRTRSTSASRPDSLRYRLTAA